MWAAMWPWPHPPIPAPRRPAERALILARALHPSFSSELAGRLVVRLSPRELGRLWEETTLLMGQSIPDDVRLNVVVLRDHLLHRLESVHPAALDECLRTGRPAGSTRQRVDRP